jgi:hypothetical protein
MPSVFSAFAIHRSSSGAINFLDLDIPTRESANGGRSIGEPEITTRFKNMSGRGFSLYSGNEIPPGSINDLRVESSDEDLLKGIDAVFEGARALTAHARDEIGGAIDVAAIDQRGFQWLRRKPIRLPA